MRRPPPAGGPLQRTGRAHVKLQHMFPQFAKGGPEQKAIEAGEIDAVIDYSTSNVILLPAARRALREAAKRESAGVRREAPHKAKIANHLLAALPYAEYQRMLADLEPIALRSGEVLYEPGVPIRYVYFPVNCAVSLLTAAEGGRPLEVGMVGREGMVGISLALGADVSSVRALVQAGGTVLRMNAGRFSEALQQCPPLRRELYRYADAKLALARQTVACNCFHAVEARLARCLLMTRDRVLAEEFFLTQAFLAQMLGVRRGTLNAAAGSLQRRKLIRFCRGTITILDSPGLEAASCSCYTGIDIRARGSGTARVSTPNLQVWRAEQNQI
jgi:CRP-like cAMP-binding protein